MPKLNLEPKGKAQELIKAYLETNASDVLAQKINEGVRIHKDGKTLVNKKTLDGFMVYAADEAKKTADKEANSAYIDDSTVYGWAIHYILWTRSNHRLKVRRFSRGSAKEIPRNACLPLLDQNRTKIV